MESTQEIVRVNLGPRSYDIAIATGNLDRVGGCVARGGRTHRAVLITDREVEPLYGAAVAASLRASDVRVDVEVVTPGERSKSPAVATALWERLSQLDVGRDTAIVALGGGVVGDLAGFVAASYARGLPFFQVPTTLLAQVDSSVGGKVGVNLPLAKNMVGAFWQPYGVLIDTAVLQSLPDREYRAGLAEVVKYGVILDARFFAELESEVEALNERNNRVLRRAISRSCQLKAQVVEQDEREETGIRAVLNYGHTFCHALETVTGYQQLLHGEAVAIGMTCAARLAERLGRVDEAFCERQRALLVALQLPVTPLDVDPDALLAAMARDKKVTHGRLRFVLPTGWGHVELVNDVDPADVRAVLS